MDNVTQKIFSNVITHMFLFFSVYICVCVREGGEENIAQNLCILIKGLVTYIIHFLFSNIKSKE